MTPMDRFDVNTLLTVSAVFHAFMAVVWLILVRAFRIAPVAGGLLIGAYALYALALLCLPCLAGWPAQLSRLVQGLAGLASFTLMAFAVRRLMRLPVRMHRADILLIAAGTALCLVLAGPTGQLALPLGLALLALLCARDVLFGARAEQSARAAGLLAAPFLILGVLLLTRLLSPTLAGANQPELSTGSLDRLSVAQAWGHLSMALLIAFSLVSIVCSRLISRIQYMTLRDSLTDTLNRRAIAAELQNLQAQVGRGQKHSVVMLDIDHFKRINDQYGHAAGDAALRHLVATLRADMRELDQLGRLGGEEFCLLLPHTSLNDASRVAQRMCESLRAQALSWQGQAIPMTASFGVVACQVDDPQGDVTLAMADWLVYRAKSDGRNRICVSDPDAALGRMVTV